MRKVTVSIGIPAYNEEANIKNLLLSILVQNEENFLLKEIIVISDGSTDRTVNEIKNLTDKKIELIESEKRLGKTHWLNYLFSRFKYDVFIQLDGDIQLKNQKVILELVKLFLKDRKIDLVLGNHLPLPPKTFAEKLAYFGTEIWYQAIKDLKAKSLRYHTTGQIRAFSKKFANVFRIPNGVHSTEDVYSFYFAKSHGFKVSYSEEATVYFRLPTNFSDYLKQMRRFLKTSHYIKQIFGRQMVTQYDTITTKIKFLSLLKCSIHTPIHIVISYLLLHLIAKIQALFHKHTALWEVAKTSKLLVSKNLE